MVLGVLNIMEIVMNKECILKILIIAQAFIRIITFHNKGSGHLLEATVFDNSWENFKIFKFYSKDRHITMGVLFVLRFYGQSTHWGHVEHGQFT